MCSSTNPDISLPSECDILQFEKRCEARQNEIRDGSVLAYVTKRIAATTPPRALVVLRLLLNNPQGTVCFWPNYTILFHTYTYTRSAETGEIFGLKASRSSALHCN